MARLPPTLVPANVALSKVNSSRLSDCGTAVFGGTHPTVKQPLVYPSKVTSAACATDDPSTTPATEHKAMSVLFTSRQLQIASGDQRPPSAVQDEHHFSGWP